MITEHMRRCSTSLIIREMEMKTTVRYHFPSITMATIKQTKTPEKIYEVSNTEQEAAQDSDHQETRNR